MKKTIDKTFRLCLHTTFPQRRDFCVKAVPLHKTFERKWNKCRELPQIQPSPLVVVWKGQQPQYSAYPLELPAVESKGLLWTLGCANGLDVNNNLILVQVFHFFEHMTYPANITCQLGNSEITNLDVQAVKLKFFEVNFCKFWVGDFK